jgi:vancomycin permeability regulator SanA
MEAHRPYGIATDRGGYTMPPDVPAVSSRRIAGARPRWLVPFVFLIAIVAELLAMILMTVYRYRAQGLEPVFLDPSKTGNLLGMILTASLVVLFLVLPMLRRGQMLGLASAAVAFSCLGLVILSCAPLVPAEDRHYLLLGYLLFKTFEWAFFISAIERRRRPAWRVALRTVTLTLSLLLVGGAILIGTLLLTPFGSEIADTSQRDFDAGVILGAAVWSGDRPSPVLRERINTGYDLLRQGTVQFLVVTGSNAPGEMSEAEVARRELLRRGADPTRIVVESTTRSTVQQIMFIRDQLLKQGWTSFIIISDQFHLKRALQIARFYDLDAQGVSSESPLGPENLALYHLRESVALILYWMFGV